MYSFLLKRLSRALFILFIVTFIIFLMGYFAPGDPIRAMFSGSLNPAVYVQLRHDYGFDLPWWQQYLRFIGNCLQGTFGLSFRG